MSNILYNAFETYTNFFYDSQAACFSVEEKMVTFTGKTLADEVNIFAKGLREMGINSGDSVGIALPNTKEWLISFFATQKIGANAVLLPPGNQSNGEAFLKNINDNNSLNISCFIIGDKKSANILKDSKEYLQIEDSKKSSQMEDSKKYFKIVSVDDQIEGTIPFETICKRGRSAIDADYVEEFSENCAQIIFPTEINGNLIFLCFLNDKIYERGKKIGDKIGLNSKDKTLIFFPLYHDFGVTASMISALSHLTPMHFVEPDREHYFQSIRECIFVHEATCLNCTEKIGGILFGGAPEDYLITLKKGIIYSSSDHSDISENCTFAIGTGSHGIVRCINKEPLPGTDCDILEGKKWPDIGLPERARQKTKKE